MSEQNATTIVTTKREEAIATPLGPMEESRADELRDQAAAWQMVARQARESCQRGVDAAKELQRRSNTSGQ